MKVDPNGEWSSQNRVTTSLHEIVHLGIEDTLVNKFNLSQDQKERLVDLLCNHLIPQGYGYWMQERGDRSIDRFVQNYLAGNSESLERDTANFSRRSP